MKQIDSADIQAKRYDGYLRKHIYVPVRDGVRLSVVIYIPSQNGICEQEPLPVVMQYTPYDHLVYEEDDQGNKCIATYDGLKICSLIPYGYVVVFAHVRGCGASFGVRKVVCSRQEAEDGAWLVEWLAKQKFCNGKVMTAGQSYNGQTQLEILSQKPEHLIAAYIGKTDFNRYDGWVRNGIPRAFGSKPDIDWGKDPKEIETTVKKVVEDTVPVDGDEDKVLLRQAVLEHVENGLQIPALRDLNWRDSYSEDCKGNLWEVLSASTYLNAINESKAAVYLDGGVIAVFKRDTLMLYENLTLVKKLLIGPWDHVGPKTTPEPWTEILRWGDYWLKGIDNGIMDEKPITLRVMEYNFENKTYQGENTGYYRQEDSWPLMEGRRDSFYLSRSISADPSMENYFLLGSEVPPTGEIPYRSVYGISSGVESWCLKSQDGMGAEQKGLNFLSCPFEKDREYIGHPFAYLNFTLEDTGTMLKPYDLDFFIMLSDYDSRTGDSFQFGNGWLRSSLRRESPNCPYNFLGLPWHENKLNSNEYLIPGQEYHLCIDLVPVFYRIKKGHRLMVTITNSLDRTYYYGRNVYEKDNSCVPPKIRLKIGGENPSRIILPNIYEK